MLQSSRRFDTFKVKVVARSRSGGFLYPWQVVVWPLLTSSVPCPPAGAASLPLPSQGHFPCLSLSSLALIREAGITWQQLLCPLSFLAGPRISHSLLILPSAYTKCPEEGELEPLPSASILPKSPQGLLACCAHRKHLDFFWGGGGNRTWGSHLTPVTHTVPQNSPSKHRLLAGERRDGRKIHKICSLGPFWLLDFKSSIFPHRKPAHCTLAYTLGGSRDMSGASTVKLHQLKYSCKSAPAEADRPPQPHPTNHILAQSSLEKKT